MHQVPWISIITEAKLNYHIDQKEVRLQTGQLANLSPNIAIFYDRKSLKVTHYTSRCPCLFLISHYISTMKSEIQIEITDLWHSILLVQISNTPGYIWLTLLSQTAWLHYILQLTIYVGYLSNISQGLDISVFILFFTHCLSKGRTWKSKLKIW